VSCHWSIFFFFFTAVWARIFIYYMQHCFICLKSASNVSVYNAGIEPRAVALLHWQLDALNNRLNIYIYRLDLISFTFPLTSHQKPTSQDCISPMQPFLYLSSSFCLQPYYPSPPPSPFSPFPHRRPLCKEVFSALQIELYFPIGLICYLKYSGWKNPVSPSLHPLLNTYSDIYLYVQ